MFKEGTCDFCFSYCDNLKECNECGLNYCEECGYNGICDECRERRERQKNGTKNQQRRI